MKLNGSFLVHRNWFSYFSLVQIRSQNLLSKLRLSFCSGSSPFPNQFLSFFLSFFFFLTRPDFLQNLSWLNQVSLETMAFLRKLKETQGNHNKKSLNSENLWENFRQDILQHYRNSSVTIYLKFFGIFHSLYHYLFL